MPFWNGSTCTLKHSRRETTPKLLVRRITRVAGAKNSIVNIYRDIDRISALYIETEAEEHPKQDHHDQQKQQE